MGRHHSSKSFQQACCLHQADLSTSSYQRAGLHLLRFTVINLTYFEKKSHHLLLISDHLFCLYSFSLSGEISPFVGSVKGRLVIY